MRVVLHICCGVCVAGAAERLLVEGHQVTGFFYNPNLYPAEEYTRRLETAQQVAREMGFPLEAPMYAPDEWLSRTKSLENEPEGGQRCNICFRLRLERTYLYLKETAADAFTTTLTIGPRKPAQVVNKIGLEIDSHRFLVRDFKKQDGFRRATELAKKWQLYRQNYCGCIYSLRQRAINQASS